MIESAILKNTKELISKFGIRPSTVNGQNFLVDPKILSAIIEKANIKPRDTILEIGPGFGVLTEALLARAAKVVAVEKDKALAGYLRTQLRLKTQLNIINADILRLDLVSLGFKTQPNAEDFQTQAYRIIANIPYSITGKLINKFVSGSGPKPVDMLILVQKEVGERICARPGQMSLLALSVQLYAEPSIVFNVSRHSFWPEPKVDSVLLKISNIKGKTLYPIQDERFFWRLLHIGFSSRRKQLHNNLAAGLLIGSDEVKKALLRAGISVQARAQELSIEQWIKLSEHLTK